MLNTVRKTIITNTSPLIADGTSFAMDTLPCDAVMLRHDERLQIEQTPLQRDHASVAMGWKLGDR